MRPQPIEIFGGALPVWNLALIAGVLVGYFFLRLALTGNQAATWRRFLVLRYSMTVYLCTIGAQAFAYLVDENTTVTPPADVGVVAYYLNPFAGPKTLYGAILVLPGAIALTALPFAWSSFGRIMGQWTPALMIVLTAARIGCLFTGCCYGVRSDLVGLRFAADSVVHARQVGEGLITAGMPAAPVVPTQLLEGALCMGLALRALWEIRNGRGRVFGPTLAMYAVGRFLVELVRADPDRGSYGVLATSQWISLAILVAFIAQWLRRSREELPA
jgi:phosphatidylglycerol:prolipoprotein diacylglycerol transferase